MTEDNSMLEVKVRTSESTTSDKFVNINDLIIDLMMEMDKVSSQQERDFIKKLIKKLTSLRAAKSD